MRSLRNLNGLFAKEDEANGQNCRFGASLERLHALDGEWVPPLVTHCCQWLSGNALLEDGNAVASFAVLFVLFWELTAKNRGEGVRYAVVANLRYLPCGRWQSAHRRVSC